VNECKPRVDDATPLAAAAQQGFLDVVERLLAAGADVNKACTVAGRGLHSSTCLLNLSRFCH